MTALSQQFQTMRGYLSAPGNIYVLQLSTALTEKQIKRKC